MLPWTFSRSYSAAFCSLRQPRPSPPAIGDHLTPRMRARPGCGRMGPMTRITADIEKTFGTSRATGFQGPAPRAGGCRWPMWDNIERATHEYCGKRVRVAGEPYCASHGGRAFG